MQFNMHLVEFGIKMLHFSFRETTPPSPIPAIIPDPVPTLTPTLLPNLTCPNMPLILIPPFKRSADCDPVEDKKKTHLSNAIC